MCTGLCWCTPVPPAKAHRGSTILQLISSLPPWFTVLHRPIHRWDAKAIKNFSTSCAATISQAVEWDLANLRSAKRKGWVRAHTLPWFSSRERQKTDRQSVTQKKDCQLEWLLSRNRILTKPTWMTVSNDSFCILSNQPLRYQSGYDLHSVQMCPQENTFHMFISPNATCFVHSPFGVRPLLLRSWWGERVHNWFLFSRQCLSVFVRFERVLQLWQNEVRDEKFKHWHRDTKALVNNLENRYRCCFCKTFCDVWHGESYKTSSLWTFYERCGRPASQTLADVGWLTVPYWLMKASFLCF